MENLKSESIRNLRRPKAYISATNINHLHLRNPWVTAWWSAAFPGFGYIMLGSYIKGFALMIWELVINNLSHLNTAIYFSLLGQFELAKEIINVQWFLLYVPVYVFAIWGSYRSAVDLNKLSILADREDSLLLPVKISSLELCFLDKRHPWIAAALSLVAPGIGHLYIHRVPTGIFLTLIYVVAVYFSNILPAVHYSALGQFKLAAAAVDPQWLLFFPSGLAFAVYDAYENAVEYNRLFEKEQARFLMDHYQGPAISMTLMDCLGGAK